MKILENIDKQKTNNVSDEPTRKSKYTEMHQSVNKNKNEMNLITASAQRYGKSRCKSELNILPPSKPDMGSILSVPRASEDITKNESDGIDISLTAMNAVTKFNSGPPRHITISSEYEYMQPSGNRRAPKIPSFSS